MQTNGFSYIFWYQTLRVKICCFLWFATLCSHIAMKRLSCGTHLSYKLHDFSQVLLLLQNLFGLCAQRNKLWEMLVVVLVQSPCVFAVANEPVDGGEVFPLSQLLVQPPEHLNKEVNESLIQKRQTPIMFEMHLKST